MYQIHYECNVRPNDCAQTVYYTERFTARGNTAEEVKADAAAIVARWNAFNVQAIGLNNYRADWEAVFGPSDMPDTAFYDSRLEEEAQRAARVAIRPWWKRFWPVGADHPSRRV